MEESNDRLDRVEQILREMAARQHYHDEAFERFDARMKADAEEWRERMARQDERVARHEEWLVQHNEHLARQAEYLDRMADQVNAALLRVTDHFNDRMNRLTDRLNDIAALTSQNAIQIDKLSEAWLYHNKRINALEERQAS